MVGALRIVGDAGRPSGSMLLARTGIRLQEKGVNHDNGLCNSEAKVRTDASTIEHHISCSSVAETHEESNSSGQYDCYEDPSHYRRHCREKCIIRRSSEEVGVGQGYLPQG